MGVSIAVTLAAGNNSIGRVHSVKERFGCGGSRTMMAYLQNSGLDVLTRLQDNIFGWLFCITCKQE